MYTNTFAVFVHMSKQMIVDVEVAMDFVGLGVVLMLALVFAFLAVRSWRARRLWVKLVAGIPTTLLAVVFVAALGLAIYGYSKVNKTYANPVADIKVAGTPEQIAHGEKFARTCTGCHSTTGNFPLSGQDFAADGPPLGTLWAANLTQAHFKDWSDGEIIRAIREGVSKDGRSLIIMPSHLFHNFSDDDVQAIVAYLRSQPAVEPNTPPKQISVVGALMAGALLPDDIFTHQAPIIQPVIAPPAGTTAEYGHYLSAVAGCVECHGAQLNGGENPNVPAGPSLVAFAQQHSEADFITTIRTGVTPEGHKLSEDMPWKDFEKFSDDDLRALYAYMAVLGK
jgi:cytochrome c553